MISPILSAKMGYGLPQGRALLGLDALDKNPMRLVPEVVSPDQNFITWQLAKNQTRHARGFCRLQTGLQRDFGLAAIALAAAGDQPKPADDKGKDKPKEPEKKKPQPKDELPEEFIGQAIKETVMHEVGHSLGLRHNFKASTMLTADQLNDTSITHTRGLVGSVMDYNPINIAPKGKKQGDFFTTTIGPYDYWAIEYAYKPVEGDEAAELKKIAARAPEHDLGFASDEDLYLNDDPYVNVWDLGSDPCEFGKQRIELAAELLKNLDARVVKDGESWARTRRAFGLLLQQWGDGAVLASQYVGGHSVSRDHKADKGAHDPIVPVPGAKQRECLKFITDHILSDKSFQFSPALLRRLGTERWSHWGNDDWFGASGAVDISVLERVLGIQKIVLGHCLSASTLARLENQQLQVESGADPLRMEEVFRSLTDGIWSDLDHLPAARTPRPANSRCRRSAAICSVSTCGGWGPWCWATARAPMPIMFGYVVFTGGGAARSRPTPAHWRGCI